MKICGCEDAEKGYVILNPDSPDRREILSLNPPVCHEIISKSLDIDGVIYTFKKKIRDWTTTPLPSRLRVDWGVLGVDLIDGSAYSRTSSIVWKSVKIFDKPAPQDYGTAQGAYEFHPIAGKDLWGCWEYGGGNFYPFLSISSIGIGVAYYMSGGQGWVAMYYLNGQGQSGANPDTVGVSIRERANEIKITSNAGGISSRTTSTDPIISVIDGNCGLVVDFADNTQSSLIEFSQCPQNIKKIETLEVSDTAGILEEITPAPIGEIAFQCGERECPPETCCNPCEGSALNCCYDGNGRLIDSFIRRT